MNIRALLHTLAAVATAVATGTVVLAGFDEEATKIIVSFAGLTALAINSYMGFTTSGAAK